MTLTGNIEATEHATIVALAMPDNDVPLCYLCPPGTPEAHAEAQCCHCLRPVCSKHNPGDQVGTEKLGACPECLARRRGLANQALFLR